MKPFPLAIHFLLAAICFYSCKGQNSKSEIVEVSKFQLNDSTLPILNSGFYLIKNVDSGKIILKKLYDISSQKHKQIEKYYIVSLTDFVLFENIDSIYSEKSDSKYEGYYDIILKLDSVGRKQFSDLTAKTKSLTEEEKYEGLIIGTVINNTLIQLTHAHEQIDTNEIAIAGGSFYKQTVNDIIKYLEKGRRIK